MIPTDRLHELAAIAEAAQEDISGIAHPIAAHIAAFDPTTARALIAEVLTLREQRDKVLALHKRIEVDALSSDCAEDVGCGHEDGCPTIQAPVCAACHDIGELAARYPWEESLEGCAWPCDTVRALNVTEEADR